MFDKYFTGQLGKEGLIIDERFNHGGMSPDFYTEKLGRRLLLALAQREGKPFVPQAAFFGPKVMLPLQPPPARGYSGSPPGQVGDCEPRL